MGIKNKIKIRIKEWEVRVTRRADAQPLALLGDFALWIALL